MPHENHNWWSWPRWTARHYLTQRLGRWRDSADCQRSRPSISRRLIDRSLAWRSLRWFKLPLLLALLVRHRQSRHWFLDFEPLYSKWVPSQHGSEHASLAYNCRVVSHNVLDLQRHRQHTRRNYRPNLQLWNKSDRSHDDSVWFASSERRNVYFDSWSHFRWLSWRLRLCRRYNRSCLCKWSTDLHSGDRKSSDYSDLGPDVRVMGDAFLPTSVLWSRYWSRLVHDQLRIGW